MFGRVVTSWIVRALFLLATVAAFAWWGAQPFSWASVVTALATLATFIGVEVKASIASKKWPPEFSELDYVRHVSAHRIRLDAIESSFTAAKTLEDLSERLRLAAPNRISCPWFDQDLMATKYLAQINLARDVLGLPHFPEPAWREMIAKTGQ